MASGTAFCVFCPPHAQSLLKPDWSVLFVETRLFPIPKSCLLLTYSTFMYLLVSVYRDQLNAKLMSCQLIDTT